MPELLLPNSGLFHEVQNKNPLSGSKVMDLG